MFDKMAKCLIVCIVDNTVVLTIVSLKYTVPVELLVGHRRVAFLHRSTGYDHLRISCAVGSLPVRLVFLVVLGRGEAQH